MPAVLSLCNVVKTYPSGVSAVAGISADLDKGVVGLIGHNGAGKTTLIGMIATLTRPTSGQILFEGGDTARAPDALRRRLGFLPQEFGIQDAVTAHDFLTYLAALKGVRDPVRVRRCLDMVNLQAHAGRRVGDFSGGMRRRLGIAQALLNDPALLIVDEPTTGLDLDERLRFRSLMAELGSSRLVILSTHIVSDVEHVATELIVMRQGRMILHDTPAAVLAQARGRIWSATVPAADYAGLRERTQVLQARQLADGYALRIAHPVAPCANAQLLAPSLEDALMLHTRAPEAVMTLGSAA
jgi:ABC-2 type transport system ATP-binding protein